MSQGLGDNGQFLLLKNDRLDYKVSEEVLQERLVDGATL